MNTNRVKKLEAEMPIAYKLVSQDYRTRIGEENETRWMPHATITAQGLEAAPCTDGVIHSYRSPVLAAFANPIHARISKPRCLVIEVPEVLGSDGLKQWSSSATWRGDEVSLPTLTTTHRVEIAIHCVLRVYKEDPWATWARRWLAGDDRTDKAAWAAARTASWAAALAAEAAARAASWTARDLDVSAIIQVVIRSESEKQ
jgi:hypothetical protein